MEFDLVFFGVNLLPFIVGIIALLRAETNLSDYVVDWVSALLFGVGATLALEPMQQLLQGVPVEVTSELIFRLVTTFVGVVLTIKGYFPTTRSIINKAKGGNDITYEPRNVFTGRY